MVYFVRPAKGRIAFITSLGEGGTSMEATCIHCSAGLFAARSSVNAVWSRRRSAVAGIVALAVALLLLPTSAFAATFAYQYPVGTLHGSPNGVGVSVTGSPAFKTTTAKLKIDNVAYTTSVSLTATGHWAYTETGPDINGAYKLKWIWVTDPRLPNQASLSCYPSGAPLADGTHNATATITDNANVTWTYSWSYVVATPPTFGAPLPVAGTRVKTPTPVISVPVSDNIGVSSASATVNGQPATATLSGGRVAITGFTSAADGPVVVAVTARDAVGNTSVKTWTFAVSYFANLTCHTPSCHGAAYDTDNAMGSDCVSCHPSAVSDHSTLHTTALPAVSCQDTGCHPGTNLGTIHAAMACAACHSSSDSNVTGAITANDKRCATCHPSAASEHVTVHQASLSTETIIISGVSFGVHACSECHAPSNLLDVHDSVCSTCHPTPASSAKPWAKGCVQSDCHTAGSSAPMHGTIDANHVRPDEPAAADACFVSGCHTGGTNVADIHNDASDGCAVCHGTSATPTANCAASGCHDLSSPHADLASAHMSSGGSGSISAGNQADGDHFGSESAYLECATCHSTSLLTTHSDNCTLCHSSSARDEVKAAVEAPDRSCTACHPDHHASYGLNAAHIAFGSHACEGTCHNSNPYSGDPWDVSCTGCHPGEQP